VSAPLILNLLVEQKIIALDQSAVGSSLPATETMSLERAISGNIDFLGHTGSHTLGIFVQLLTTGKVKFSFRTHMKRLEILDKSKIVSRAEALFLVESLLAKLRGADHDPGLPEFTQNIIIQAPKPSQSRL